jgi:signal transduction histidine kinase
MKKFTITAILPLGLILGTLHTCKLFIDYNLNTQASILTTNFYSQNVNSLANGDSYNIAAKLNSLFNEPSILCLIATKNSQLFFQQSRTNDCSKGWLSTTRTLIFPNNKNILVTITIGLPSSLKMAILIFISIQSLLIFFYLWMRYRSLLSIKNTELLWQKKLEENARQVAHDIASPLEVLKKISSNMTESQFPHTHSLSVITSRIDSIVKSLLQIKKEGERATETENFNLIKECEKIVHEKNFMLSSENSCPLIECHFTSGQDCFLNADLSKFQRMLSNLINNAVEAFDQFDTSHKKIIKLSIHKESSNILMRIKDNGRGMDSATLFKITARRMVSTKKNGQGLGLKNALEFIKDELGGDISIQSTIGMGTTIEITLKNMTANLEQTESKTKTIALIDDDICIHHLWKMSFAGSENIDLRLYKSIEEFKDNNVPKDSLIFLDQHLNNQSCDENIVEVYAKGKFSNLFLYTGNAPGKLACGHLLQGIISNKKIPLLIINNYLND